MMKDLDLKNKVLDEIISMMGDKEGEMLKKKSPKFMAMEIEMKKPMEGEEKESSGLMKMMSKNKPMMGESEKPEMEMEGDEIPEDVLEELLRKLQG